MDDHRVIFDTAPDYSFEKFTLLTQDEVVDLISTFYRWGPARFLIRTDEKERKFMGQCQSWPDMHTITLCEKNIRREFGKKGRMGGSMVAPNLKVGAGMVLTHEIQHANQSKLHKGNNKFWGKLGGITEKGNERMQKYWYRACERDARGFVDEHVEEIYAYFDVSTEGLQTLRACGTIGDNGRESGEVSEVIALFMEGTEVSMEDVKEELRQSGVLNPGNVQRVVKELREAGIEVQR